MALDVDYIAGKVAIGDIQEVLEDVPHGEREKIADEIIAFAKQLKKTYTEGK